MELRLRHSPVAEGQYGQSPDSESLARFEVGRKEVRDLLVATVRPNGRPSQTKRSIEHLLNHLKKTSEEPILCLYSDGEPGKELIAEWCVPVSGPVNREQFETRILRGCTVLSYFHMGHRNTLGQAWEMMFDYIEGNNIQISGPRREIYHDSRTPDRTRGPIELQVPLASNS